MLNIFGLHYSLSSFSMIYRDEFMLYKLCLMQITSYFMFFFFLPTKISVLITRGKTIIYYNGSKFGVGLHKQELSPKFLLLYHVFIIYIFQKYYAKITARHKDSSFTLESIFFPMLQEYS